MQELDIGNASDLEPRRPVFSIIEMQQRKPRHVRKLRHSTVLREELWAAHDEQLLRAQASNLKSRPIPIAVTHGDIDVLSGEVDMMEAGGNPEIDLRMHLG